MLIREGDPVSSAFFLLEGWAVRYEYLADGRRQITAILLPGDVFNLNAYLFKKADDSIMAISDVTVGEMSRRHFEELTSAHPATAKSFLWCQLVELAVEREWVVNLGRRTSTERICHIFCELYLRLASVVALDGDGFLLPLTQNDLADATGMTSVHVNRVLRQLRRSGSISFRHRHLQIEDFGSLQKLAGFDPSYLHLDRWLSDAKGQD